MDAQITGNNVKTFILLTISCNDTFMKLWQATDEKCSLIVASSDYKLWYFDKKTAATD